MLRLFSRIKLATQILFYGDDQMVVVYVTLIVNGRRTYNSVPMILKADVKADLEAMGFTVDDAGDVKTASAE